MKALDKKIHELNLLLKSYEFDELSLSDLDYMDECFEDIVMNLRELKNDLVNFRFLRVLDL